MPRKSGGNKSINELQRQVAAMDLRYAEMKVKIEQDVVSSQKYIDLAKTCQNLRVELIEAEKEKVEFLRKMLVQENLVKTLRELNQKQADVMASMSTRLELHKEVFELKIQELAMTMAAGKRGNKRKAKSSSKKGNINGKELQDVYKRVQARLGGLISANYSHFKPETGEGFPLRQQRSTEEDFEDGLLDYLDGIWDVEPLPEPEVAEKVELVTLPIYKSEVDREELDRRWNEMGMLFKQAKTENSEEIERKDQPDVGEKVELEIPPVSNGSETTETDSEESDRRWNEWAVQFQMMLDDMETEDEDEN